MAIQKKLLLQYVLIFLLAVGIAVPLILPYLHQGYFASHDGEWAVVRSVDMFREIRDLQIPPRYSGVLNEGYGYPLFNFAYPFPYYLTTLLHLFHIGFIQSVKVLFIGSIIFSAFFTYLASKNLWKNSFSGLISIFLFTFLPYRIVDLFVRGSLGESISFVLFPILIWCMVKLYEKPFSKRYTILAALVFAAQVVTHNIMFLYISMTIGLTIFVILIFHKKQVALSFILFLIFGILLSSYFWVPAVLEKNIVLFAKIPIAVRDNYFVSLPKLFIPSWGYGDPSTASGFSYQLGIPQIISFLLVLLSLLVLYGKQKKKDGYYFLAIFLSVSTLVFSFFLFSPSKILWQIIPLLKDVNFPWTMLGIIGFLISLTAGYLGKVKKLRYIGLLVSFSGIILVSPYIKPVSFNTNDDNYYITNDATTTASFEFMPLWVKTFPTNKPAEKVLITKGQGTIENTQFNSRKLTFQATLSQPSKMTIQTIYYPGWVIKANNKMLPISYTNPKGLMEFTLPRGNYNVIAVFQETPSRLLADSISILAFLSLMVWSLFGYFRIKSH